MYDRGDYNSSFALRVVELKKVTENIYILNFNETLTDNLVNFEQPPLV